MPRMNWLGVDTGGTFTDFVLFGEVGEIKVHKVLSTPHAPEQAILQGIAEMQLDLQQLRVVHGSTVATNAALEGKGVKTAFVTNRGFADLLSIGRQNRRELYNLQPQMPAPPVAKSLCVETGGRLSAQGEVLEPLSQQDIQQLADDLQALAPEAVAINLLFSYLKPELEEALRAAVPEGVFVSLSSEVLPEVGEYERGMATWLNAWVGPLVAGYLRRLTQGLPGVPVSVMQSAGDTVAAAQAAEHAVRLLLSGPAGGLVGARYVAGLAGFERLLTFDMGGTSTDVALIDGEVQLTTEGRIADYPVAVPMMDIHTIGAGGGSIAWLDDGGMLQLGPQSAGAAPGPACYGKGGNLPTVTDANLLLGRLRADAFLGGDMALDVDAARSAMQPIALALGCDEVGAARAIIDIANAHMARALRAMSIKRGADARDYALVSFGGAGALHVCELAEAMEMRNAVVPVHGGVLSALGMLASRPGRQFSRTLMLMLDDDSADQQVSREVARLSGIAAEALAEEGVVLHECELLPSVDLRYRGQSYTLNLPWEYAETAIQAFHRLHQARYGHAMQLPVELVTLRLAVLADGNGFKLPREQSSDKRAAAGVSDGAVSLIERAAIVPEQTINGPAVITEQVATTWLAEGWQAQLDGFGNLVLRCVGE